MRRNPVKFAVVREDPRVEDALVRRVRARRALLIGSGGCTALSLRALHPELELVLLDPNASQLDRIERKIAALSETGVRRGRLFGIGIEDPEAGLNSSGEFESLFRSFRRFLEEFVLDRQGWMALLAGDRDPSPGTLSEVFGHPYWAVAFELHFSEALLNAMFTPAATQHAPRGSYPGYFRRVIERMLAAPEARDNYFLHHVFLGHYLDRPSALPSYLAGASRGGRIELLEGAIDTVPSFGRFDLIHLSNIFDWMDRDAVAAVAARIASEMRPGACLVYRQLNNESDFRPYFGEGIVFDGALGRRLLEQERAGFYMAIGVGTKLGAGEAR